MRRMSIKEFSFANPLYRGATVTAYTVSGGAKTVNLATLYSGASGVTQLANPQKLDGYGKWKQPVYVETAVILTISGLSIPSHDTGIIGYYESADGYFGVVDDNGDADVYLTAGTSKVDQIWGTPLTTGRVARITLTGVYEGARFRIVRAASATGASSLQVSQWTVSTEGILKNLAAGQWCEAVHDGTEWRLTAFGSL